MRITYLLSIFLLLFLSISSSAQLPRTVPTENTGQLAEGIEMTNDLGARCTALAITHYQLAINDRSNRADNYYLAASYEALGRYQHTCI